MRVNAIYRRFPVNEREVEKHLGRLSRGLQVSPPKVAGWWSANAQYDPETQTLKIPSNKFCEKYDPDIVGDYNRYWGLVLHEYAHYLEHVWLDEVGHSPAMYAIALGLAMREGIPLDDFVHYENSYLPGALKRGMKAAGDAILTKYKGTIR